MDTGEGKFEKFASIEQFKELQKQYPKAKGIFRIGEELKIKGSRFKVIQITPFGIRLKLLKQ